MKLFGFEIVFIPSFFPLTYLLNSCLEDLGEKE
jgi:hypothetical protein